MIYKSSLLPVLQTFGRRPLFLDAKPVQKISLKSSGLVPPGQLQGRRQRHKNQLKPFNVLTDICMHMLMLQLPPAS
jgi:hypothetical protein